MAIIGEFNCYVCGKVFLMGYGGLLSNPSPKPSECICPQCRVKHEAMAQMLGKKLAEQAEKE